MRELRDYLADLYITFLEYLGISQLLGVHILFGIILLIKALSYYMKEPKDRNRKGNDIFTDIVFIGIFIYLFFRY